MVDMAPPHAAWLAVAGHLEVPPCHRESFADVFYAEASDVIRWRWREPEIDPPDTDAVRRLSSAVKVDAAVIEAASFSDWQTLASELGMTCPALRQHLEQTAALAKALDVAGARFRPVGKSQRGRAGRPRWEVTPADVWSAREHGIDLAVGDVFEQETV